MTISYLDVISRFFPEIQISATGSSYSNINWEHGGPIAQNELEDKMIDLAKERKIEELSMECERSIISGFLSAALGSTYVYDSEEVDQVNLLGAVTSSAPTQTEPTGYAIYYACRNVETGVKSYHEHSYAQLRQVLADGSLFKLFYLQKFHEKRVLVQNCLTVDEVDLINWI